MYSDNHMNAVHLRANHAGRVVGGARRNGLWQSTYCNKGWSKRGLVGINLFLMIAEVEPSSACGRCVKKAKKAGFFEDPGLYEAEQGMILLSEVEL